MQKSIFDFRKGTFYRVFFMIFCLKNSTNVYFEVQTLLKRAFVPVQTSAVQKKHCCTAKIVTYLFLPDILDNFAKINIKNI